MNRPKWFDEYYEDDEKPPTFIFSHPNGTVRQIPLTVQLRDATGRMTDFPRHYYLIVRKDGNELWVRHRQNRPPMKPATEHELSLMGMADAIELCIKGARGKTVTEEELNEMAT